MMILNEKQEKVVYSNERFLFLLAGAGSGKTRVIVERIKHLISTGVDPHHILAVTFTHKAATEMKERIHHDDVCVHTFHQYALNMLKQHQGYAYKILNQENIVTLKEALDISNYKNHLYEINKPKIYDDYQMTLSHQGLKDFDDILIDFYMMLKKRQMRTPFTYIFVDEFQDTNMLQYHILKLMIHKDTSVCAVGDPDQSIYQFRGANDKIIETFIKTYDAHVYILDMNYRSSPNILEIANRFIIQNQRRLKKKLIPYHEENYDIEKLRFKSLEEETSFIIKRYRGFVLDGIKPNEIAVIYRNHHRSYVIRDEIKKRYMDKTYGLQLLTMHEAKGLEFDVVFIIGLEDGEIPSYHMSTYKNLEEERRLLYVSMTRARKYLYFSYVEHMENGYKKMSPFYKKIKFLKKVN